MSVLESANELNKSTESGKNVTAGLTTEEVQLLCSFFDEERQLSRLSKEVKRRGHHVNRLAKEIREKLFPLCKTRDEVAQYLDYSKKLDLYLLIANKIEAEEGGGFLANYQRAISTVYIKGRKNKNKLQHKRIKDRVAHQLSRLLDSVFGVRKRRITFVDEDAEFETELSGITTNEDRTSDNSLCDASPGSADEVTTDIRRFDALSIDTPSSDAGSCVLETNSRRLYSRQCQVSIGTIATYGKKNKPGRLLRSSTNHVLCGDAAADIAMDVFVRNPLVMADVVLPGIMKERFWNANVVNHFEYCGWCAL